MTWSPHFIGIGAEKSATTWAWTMLNEHPSVCMSQPKELNYFNIEANFERGSEWYQKHFADTSLCCGEITPLYMDDQNVAERIRSTCPDAKLFVMLRNPFDRAISHLFHDASVAYGKVASLTAADMQQLVTQDDKYIRRSCYAAALKPFLETFSADRIGVFFFDDVRADGAAVARRLYDFIGVSDDFIPERYDQKVNDSQDMRSATLMNSLKRISGTAKAFPPTRFAMDWVYRHTQLREKIIRLVMVDKGRPEITFDDVFDAQATATLMEDMSALRSLLPCVLPDQWLATPVSADAPVTVPETAAAA